MSTYKLTNAATLDFESIFEFGIDTFGLQQATKYQREMIAKFEQIGAQPEQFPKVDHIRPRYRRCVFGSHSIYYLEGDEFVIIVRILGQQNPGDAFS